MGGIEPPPLVWFMNRLTTLLLRTGESCSPLWKRDEGFRSQDIDYRCSALDVRFSSPPESVVGGMSPVTLHLSRATSHGSCGVIAPQLPDARSSLKERCFCLAVAAVKAVRFSFVIRRASSAILWIDYENCTFTRYADTSHVSVLSS